MPDDAPISDPDAETEVLDDEPKSMLLALIGQLRKGMDLHRVTLPTFILEPRSMLERITDFMAHPDILISANKEKDDLQRFLLVLKYYLSGWHIRPKGVKKPYNPVLGEFFRCDWKFADGSDAHYVAEQVSHHPPISAYYYNSPENGISVAGEFRPTSKFLGNSAATLMAGGSTIRLSNYPRDEYHVTYPNVYARGLLFGTMLLELGDTAVIDCPQSKLVADIEFTTKGFFTGTYNAIKGKIKDSASGEVLYTISGKWTDTIYIQENVRGAPTTVLFDVKAASIHQKLVQDESKQEEMESRKLWSQLTAAMLKRDMDLATQEKTKIEDHQRELRQQAEKAGGHDRSDALRYFSCEIGKDEWTFRHQKSLQGLQPKQASAKLKDIIAATSNKQQ